MTKKKDDLPRIVAVRPGDEPLTLVVDWKGGGRDTVDLTGLVGGDPAFARLAEPAFFATVHTVGYGSGIAWTDDLDISGGGLETMAEEQRPMTKGDFVGWLKARHLSAQEAADLIGRSATQVKAYRSGQAAIPAPVAGFVRAMIRDELVFLSHYRPRRPVGRPRKRA
jgi:hypothetical protein